MRDTRFTRGDALFLFVVVLLFYMLCRFTWIQFDDCLYAFQDGIADTFTGHDGPAYKPVASLYDAFMDQVRAYTRWNGRVIVHTLTAWMSAVAGAGFFRVANSLVFGILVAGMVTLLRLGWGRHTVDMPLVVAALFLLLPTPAETTLGWVALAVNYLWTAAAVVWFLVLMRMVSEGRVVEGRRSHVWVFLVSMLVGSMQESFTIGVSAAIFLSLCISRRMPRGNMLSLALGFWLGTAFVTLAPGNFARLSMSGDNANHYLINVLAAIRTAPLTALLLVLAGVGLWRDRRRMSEFLMRERVLILASLANLAVAFLTYQGHRQMFSIELFSFLVLAGWIYGRFPRIVDKYGRTLSAVCCAAMLLAYFPAYGYRQNAYEACRRTLGSRVESGCFTDASYLAARRDMMSGYLRTRYVLMPVLNPWVYKGYSLTLTGGHDSHYVRAAIPGSMKTVVSLPYGSDGIYHNEAEDYYVIRRDTAAVAGSLWARVDSNGFFEDIKTRLLSGGGMMIDITGAASAFTYGGCRYYVYYNERERPAREFIFK